MEKETPFETPMEKCQFEIIRSLREELHATIVRLHAATEENKKLREAFKMKEARADSVVRSAKFLVGPSSLLAALFLFLAPVARADHIVLAAGPSMNGSTNPKFASAGYEKVFGQGSLLGQCGAFFESPTIGNCSVILSGRLETTSGLFTRIGAGPGFITSTDDRLSSIFEFNIRYAIGLASDGWQIGVEGSHWSNAGLVPPNFGRDFLGLLVEIGL